MYRTSANSVDNQTMLFSAQFNYANTFNKVHNLSAMLIASGFQQSKSGLFITRTQVLILPWMHLMITPRTYYADFGLAAIHSAQLAPGHRVGFFSFTFIGLETEERELLEEQQGGRRYDDQCIW